MEYAKALISFPSLEKYKINLAQEAFRKSLMLLLFALTVYLFPFQPSKTPIYCVHKCLLKDDLFFEYVGNMSLTVNEHFSYDDFWKFSKFLWNETRHPCVYFYGLDDKYIFEKRTKLANSICPLKHVEKQIYLAVICFVIFAIWTILQCCWIYMSDELIQGLLSIRKFLKDAGFCTKCIKNFVREGGVQRCQERCRALNVDIFQTQHLIHDQLRLSGIHRCYLAQNLGNLLLCIAVIAILCIYPAFETLFECEIPDTIPLGTDLYLNLKDMHCLNPDAVTILPTIRVMVVILAGLLMLSLKNIMEYRSIAVTLFQGVREKDN